MMKMKMNWCIETTKTEQHHVQMYEMQCITYAPWPYQSIDESELSSLKNC